MSQSHFIEVDYQKFLNLLREATNSKHTIEKTNKEAWTKFVRTHGVPEGGMGVYAKAGAMSGNTKAVIIDGAGESDGYYIYSSEDRYCLKCGVNAT